MDFFFILCAKYLFVIVFLIAGIYFLKQPRDVQIKIFIYGFVCAVVSYMIALIGGQIFFDPRPFVEGHFKPLIDHDTENGFPSDHVLLVSAVASTITVFNKKVAVGLWLMTAFIAYARVYVGVHHFIDVFMSMAITIIVTVVIVFILNERKMDRVVGTVKNVLHWIK